MKGKLVLTNNYFIIVIMAGTGYYIGYEWFRIGEKNMRY